MAHSEDECSDPRCRIALIHDGPHVYTLEAWQAWREKRVAEDEERRNREIYLKYKKDHNL